MHEAFPLYWPDGWKRTDKARRIPNGSWKKTFYDYQREMFAELRRLGAKNIVLSTNVPLRKDGLPYSEYRRVEDPGVAVYFTRGEQNRQYCFACDKFTDVHLNIHAIGLTIQALRTIERNGASDMLDRAFEGFKQLAAKASAPWRQVLEIEITWPHRDAIEEAFKRLARIHHPDLGGDAERFREIVRARDEARKEIGE